tara:strand:+ start:115 stop:288 length:174 start_codon:yes stop_codon:yes gene_type:complete
MKFCFAFLPNILFHLIGEIPSPGRLTVKFFSVKTSPLKIFSFATMDGLAINIFFFHF